MDEFEKRDTIEPYKQWGEKVEVLIAADSFTAKVTLRHMGDEAVSFNDILSALNSRGVVMGIRNDYIQRLADHPVYDKPIKVAEGKLASHGVSGEIIYHFNTDNNLLPKVLEDGSTDYKNIGFVNDAKEGDILCDIVEPKKGEDGYNVLGKILSADMAKEAHSPCGANTKPSEDGKHLIATCDGHVSLKDGKVQIKKVMNIDQVDQTTGNILFSGDVNINRDVRDGFSVRAGGTILVKGVVEGAVLIAGRDIIVNKGTHGKDSVLSAGGMVKTGYIEMAQIKAKDAVFADAVLNADIKCGGKVTLSGKRGCLIGGSCTALELEANDIGNDANILTEIFIVDPELNNKELEDVKTKINECVAGLERLSESFKAASQLPQDKKTELVTQILQVKRESEAELRELNAKYQELSEVEVEYRGKVVYHGNMNHNVSVDISGLILRNTYRRPACTMYRKKDKILFMSPTGSEMPK